MGLRNVLTHEFVFMCIWVVVETRRNTSSFKITRGEYDKVWYGKDFREMVKNTDKHSMKCDKSQQECQCKYNAGYKTIIVNDTQLKCVEDKFLGIVGQDGTYLKNGKGECLGVAGHFRKNCSDDLSLRWSIFRLEHILNLKTLKCLTLNKTTQTFTTQNCKDNESQKWTFKKRLIRLKHDPKKTKRLISDLTRSEFKVCYHVSGDKKMAVIKKSPKIEITINAPIYEESSRCTLNWELSRFSKLGQNWTKFSPMDHELFTLKRINRTAHFLNITNSNKLFERWQGTLIKLGIKCGQDSDEGLCVMMKIESTEEIKTTLTTPPVTENDEKTMLFIVPVVVLLCLLAAALVIVFCYRRRRKRANEESNFYEETTVENPMTHYEDPSQRNKIQQPTPNPYASPGMSIPVGSDYECPDNGSPQQNSDENKLNNNFQYDYATREETSLLPLNGDVKENSDAAGNPFYHTLEEDKDVAGGNLPTPPEDPLQEGKVSQAGKSSKQPIYHILEDDTSHQEEKRGAGAKQLKQQPVYHTLENNYEEIPIPTGQ